MVYRHNILRLISILDTVTLKDIMQVQILAEEWMQDYNYCRPHEALNGKTPMEYKALPAACSN